MQARTLIFIQRYANINITLSNDVAVEKTKLKLNDETVTKTGAMMNFFLHTALVLQRLEVL